MNRALWFVFVMACFSLLIADTSGSGIVQQTEKKVSICTTPKVGCSEQLDYLRWMEVGPPKACVYTPNHIPNWELNCTVKIERKVRYVPDDMPPLRFLQSSPPVCPAKNTLVVMYRDPWNRLLSGFGSKFHSHCKQDVKCFQKGFMPNFNPEGTNHLHAYLLGIADIHEQEKTMNAHFSPQHKTPCLSESLMESVSSNHCELRSGDIDNGGLDVVSSALGHVGNDSFTSYMGSSYHMPETCYNIPAHLLARVVPFLAGDYERIHALFGKQYRTEKRLRDAVHFKNGAIKHIVLSVCHRNHSFRVLGK